MFAIHLALFDPLFHIHAGLNGVFSKANVNIWLKRWDINLGMDLNLCRPLLESLVISPPLVPLLEFGLSKRIPSEFVDGSLSCKSKLSAMVFCHMYGLFPARRRQLISATCGIVIQNILAAS